MLPHGKIFTLWKKNCLVEKHTGMQTQRHQLVAPCVTPCPSTSGSGLNYLLSLTGSPFIHGT